MKYRPLRITNRVIKYRIGRTWKIVRRARIRFWRKKVWRVVTPQKFGRRYNFGTVIKGKRRMIKFTNRGIRYRWGRRWVGLPLRKPHRRLRRKIRRRIRRKRRRVRRRRKKRRQTRRAGRRRRRTRGRRRRRPRRCGMRVRLYRRWRRVIKRRRHFYVRYRRVLRRVSFRKSRFRIRINRKWITRPSFKRIKVRVNKRYRFVKRVTWKGKKTWTTSCFRKRRPIKFRHGTRIIRINKTWTRVRRYVNARVYYRGKKYPVVRRLGKWFVRRGKKKFVQLRVRSRGFGLKFGGKWRKIPGATIRIKVGKRWKTVKNCCNTLRLMLKGKARRMSFRNGRLRVIRKGKSKPFGTFLRRGRRIFRGRKRIVRKRVSRRGSKRRGWLFSGLLKGKRKGWLFGKKRNSITTPEDHVNEPVKPTQ